ncbi:MAG: non-canonical purine NTP pyrophosphatase, partial [Candidatus Kapaibacteriota bacterium]
MITLLIGSNNPDKAQEMQDILQAENLATILPPSAVQGFPAEIAETGATLEENAYIKAVT